MIGGKKLIARLENLSRVVEYEIPDVIQAEVMDRTAKASNGFAAAQYDGINDVVVTPDIGKNHWSITASGEAVLFIEYGSGITYPMTSQFAGQTYGPASWSASHQKWLVDPKLSKYGGKWPVPGWRHYWTRGNPSANVMYETSTVLRQLAPVRAKSAVRKALQ